MRIFPRGIAALAVLATAACASTNAAAQGVVESFKDAQKYDARCFGDDNACQEMLRAYERANAAPDATPQTRHDLFKYQIDVVARRARLARMDGRYKDAIDIASPAWKSVMEHYDKGSHAHVLIDSQALMREIALSLLVSGRTKDADDVIATARSAVDAYWSNHDNAKIKDDPGFQKLLKQALRSGEDLDSDLGQLYGVNYEFVTNHDYDRRPREKLELDEQQLRPRVAEAYGRAAEWVKRRSSVGEGNAFGLRLAPIRYADYRNWVGRMLLKDGKKKEAEEQFGVALTNACEISQQVAAMSKGFEKGMASEAVPVCDTAVRGYMVATGEADKVIREQLKNRKKEFQRIYDEQMKIWSDGAR